MRIIAGTARGRRLFATKTDMMVRPISARIRQSLFDILRPMVTGSYFLDLFAGTGAVGLEALSRGAQRAVFIEADKRCIQVIERNLE
ncbi:MAG: RsmD family RNA methyltransferase, partial [Elusimicrobia bacterium]|nr:RsmD family RNA methyltransferase [Elusimicrobiota bacterium]